MGNDDGCTDACELPGCGDGFVQASLLEQCDAGGQNSNSGACTLLCKDAACGDGLIQDNVEQCDDGPNNGAGKPCTATCKVNVCGDGDDGPNEACDDGNMASATRLSGERMSTARRSTGRSRPSGLSAARRGGYDGAVTDGTVRVQGDGSLGIKVGLGMLLCLLPGLGLYSVFGERHFLGILGACMGGLLALLAPIPLVVGARLSRHSIALAPDGTLRVTTDKRSAEFHLDALAAIILAEGARGPAVLAFKTRDELLFVDPRGFEPAALARVVAAVRAAKPALPVIGTDAAS